MKRLVMVGIVFALQSAGCKKHTATPSRGTVPEGSGSAPAIAAKSLTHDPWASPSPGAASLGAAVGEELANIKASEQAAPPGGARLKTDVSLIAEAPVDNVPIHGFAGIKRTGFTVSYNTSTNVAHEQYRKALEGNRVFEEVAEGLNKTVRLPTTVDIQLVDCDTVNAFYDPNKKRIIVCYELVDYFLDVFRKSAKNDDELGAAVIGATIFSFFHESGHALIHLLDLPAVGREEDSADQLATITLIAAGDEGVAMALSGAYWFQLQQKSDRKTVFWDEHAFDGQRFYNILCMIYGSNPSKYQGFVATGDLPKERAARCPEEFAKISRSWQQLLKPHLTSSGAENMDDAQPRIADAPSIATDAPVPSAPNPQLPETPARPPVPASDPWATPTPTPPAGNTNRTTCEQVAQQAIILIGRELEARAANISPSEVADAKAKIESELPAMLQEFIAECEREKWPEKDRQCVLHAADLAAASRCGID
ncbi:MAG: DUF4344 domain-containing metallopeptidase [Kofleriaceae bacterium]|nr:DUF4344 domain-containing metallopeptidase [Kofleriaceae bacterium]